MNAAPRSSLEILREAPTLPSKGSGMRRRALVLLGIAAAGALFVTSHAPACPMAAMLGIPCPGCGLTRATLAAVQGDLQQALALHPLVFLVTPIYTLIMGWIALSYLRGPRTGERVQTLGPPATSSSHPRVMKLVTIAGIALVALMFGVWVARFMGYFGGPVPVTSVWK
jgi:hypothetical protein